MDSGNRIVKAMLTFPYTWAAVGTLVGAEAAFIGWFEPGGLMLAVSGALGAGLLLAWWFVGSHSDAFVEHLYPRPDVRGHHRLINFDGLRSDLEKVESSRGYSNWTS